MSGRREALTRGPHPGRRDRAEPLAGPTAPYRGTQFLAMTMLTALDRVTLAKAHEDIADATDALCSLEACLSAIEHWRYVGANGADSVRWMVDDLEEAVHGLHELLVAGSS
jgi:hypothetical protein